MKFIFFLVFVKLKKIIEIIKCIWKLKVFFLVRCKKKKKLVCIKKNFSLDLYFYLFFKILN